jgi:hypothetical protein
VGFDLVIVTLIGNSQAKWAWPQRLLSRGATLAWPERETRAVFGGTIESSMQTLPLRIEKAAIRISSMRPE